MENDRMTGYLNPLLFGVLSSGSHSLNWEKHSRFVPRRYTRACLFIALSVHKCGKL